MTRYLLADDNPDVRSAVRLLLETRFEQVTVSEAADGAQLRDRLAAAPPDCLILDWELPGLSAADELAALRHLAPGMRIVVTSTRPEAAADALTAQADVFVAQTDAPDALLDALLHLSA